MLVRRMTGRVVKYTLLFSFMTSLLNLTGLVVMLAYLRFIIPSQDIDNIPVVAAAGLGVLLALGLLEFTRSRLMIRHGLFINRTLADKVLLEMLADAARQSPRGFAQGMAQLQRIQGFISSPVVFIFFDCLISPVFLLALFFFSPLMGVIVLVAMGATALIALKIQKETKSPLKEVQQLEGRNSTFLREGLHCREAVQAMGINSTIMARWRNTQSRLLVRLAQASDHAGGWTAFSRFVSVATPVIIVAIAALLIISDQMDVFSLIIVKVFALRAIGPVHGVVTNWHSLQETLTAYQGLKDLLAAESDSGVRLELPRPQGQLSVEQISYSISDTVIVRGINFDLAAGEFLGIAGPMAAGKTTLGRLLTGITQPTLGKIRLDGADMYHWNQTRLGPHLGYLPQQVELFPGTVAENIARLAQPDPTEVSRVVTVTGLDELTGLLPSGLDTHIRERGADLPGGLRQRIGLARALYGNPCLVVMDEPDINLDPRGIQELTAILTQLKASQTTLVVITHHLALLHQADKVLFLKDGRMMHFGPREQVLAKLGAARGPVKVDISL